MDWKSGKQRWLDAYCEAQAETGYADGDPRLDKLAMERGRQRPTAVDAADLERTREKERQP